MTFMTTQNKTDVNVKIFEPEHMNNIANALSHAIKYKFTIIKLSVNVKIRLFIGICEMCSKLPIKHQKDDNDVVLLSLLIILNRFHALFCCFH